MTTMRCLRPSTARRQCPLLAAFCSSLVDGLAHLESTLSSSSSSTADARCGGGGGSAPVSMRWCADAMRLLRRMQRDLLAVFRSADMPVTTLESCGGGGGDWFEQYMQETAALLDLCNAFKSAVARMHRYCMVLDFASQVGCCGGVDAVAASLVAENAAPCGGWLDASSSAAGAAVHGKLSDVKSMVSETEQLGRKIMSTSSAGDDAGGGGGSMVLVTLVAKITMAVVAASVLHALTLPPYLHDASSSGRRCTLGRAAVPEQLRPWRESLSAINDRIATLPASVAEHERVTTAVRDMIDAAKMEGSENDHAAVELLRTRSGELREGVEMFDCVLDQVFDEVIKGRNEMLGIFREKALT